MKKFFIFPESIKGNLADITGAEAHHILDVLRLGKGDKIQAFDGTGRVYRGRILDTTRKQVKIEIEEVITRQQAENARITLVQALLKKNKIDYIVEKATELGVDKIIPVQTKRSILKLDHSGQFNRLRRWRRIAQEAAKQCGRSDIPIVHNIAGWGDILGCLSSYDLKLCFSLSDQARKLKDAFSGLSRSRNIVLFIGPEGDFTPEELDQAAAAGCLNVSLGENVLKSDTACICALAMIKYELGQ